MKLRFGITLKFFLWYFVLIFIFYGIILGFFLHSKKIMKVSNDIVNKKYKISSYSKKMIENLLSMEENEKKYKLLNKEEYKKYFRAARNEFEKNLSEILKIESGMKDTIPWGELDRSYRKWFSEDTTVPEGDETSKDLWIPEEVINEWIQRVSIARSEDEQKVELAMTELHQQGQTAMRWGVVGFEASIIAGLVGIILLGYYVNRPLRELLRGISSISREGDSKPIRILSKDEFGELTIAFNDMIARLKEEERMRSNFIAMLSHEIRTPLTSIQESVNLIREELMGPVNDRQGRFLKIAGLEIERIIDLLNHLLQVSRMEAGILKINSRPLDPSALVLGSLQRLTPSSEAQKIKIQAEVPSDLPGVMGDLDHLQQVLLNLLGNAVKFSSSGGEVIVRVEPAEDQTGLVFSVSDNGPGIPEEQQPFVFRKYYRVSGVQALIDGIGLGLSISKQIIEAHGGRIWLESRPGYGSTFGFTLPFASKK
jgi:signal transduction histidine kinase